MEHNVCSGSGTCAIELDYSDQIVVQYNEVYDTRKKMGGADNNAIDTDGETTNCLIQYNYVYNNGDGFLLCGTDFSTAVYRYNIIHNSGADDHYIGLYGDSGWNMIHNNLLYSDNNAKSFVGRPGGKNIDKSSNPISYYNNIFYDAAGGSAELYQGTYSDYNNNAYVGAKISIPSSDDSAVTIAPGFTGTFDGDLEAFRITAESILVDVGMEITYPETFGGEFLNKYLYDLDFYGNPVELQGKPDIGVSEYQFGEGMGILNGFVIDQYGNPALGAVVAIVGQDKSAVVDGNGYYSLGEIAAGSYSLRVSKADYDDNTIADQEVTEGSCTRVNMELGECQLATGLLKGTVKTDGVVADGVKVTLSNGSGTVAETTTDSKGEYCIEALEGAEYTLTFAKDGYKVQRQNAIEVQKGNQKTIDVVLQSNDYSNTQYLINEGFSNYAAGIFASNDMWTVNGTAGTLTIEEEESGNKYLRINKTSNGMIGLYNTTAANLGGSFSVEARVMRTTGTNQFGMYSYDETTWNSGMQSKPSGGKTVATFYASEGDIYTHYRAESGSGASYEAATYELNEWHTIRWNVNLDEGIFDFYVDDMSAPVFSGYNLRNTKATIDRFLFYSNASGSGDLCIDYFRVNTGASFDRNDTVVASIEIDGVNAECIDDSTYEIVVTSATERVEVLPKARSIFATMVFNDTVVSEQPIGVSLNNGDNEFMLTVTAEDGTMKDYIIIIHRATEAEERDAQLDFLYVNDVEAEKVSEKEYSIKISSNTQNLKIEPIAHDTFYAEVNVEGQALNEDGCVELLMDGNKKVITVQVVSKEGITTQYTLTVEVEETIVDTGNEPEEDTEYLINEDFEDYATGSVSSGDALFGDMQWTVEGTAGIVTIEAEDNGNQYLKISKTSTGEGSGNMIGLYNPVAANLNGSFTIEARVMRTEGTNQFGMYSYDEATWNNGMLSSPSGGKAVATFYALDGQIYTHYKTESGSGASYAAISYGLNEWHTIRWVVDLEEGIFDLYVDDMLTPIFENYKLRNAKETLDRFLFYSNASGSGDICIDYFRVNTGAAFDRNDTTVDFVQIDGVYAENTDGNTYRWDVPASTESVEVLPKARSIFTTMVFDGVPVSEQPVKVSLNSGNNEFLLTVTAEDGTTKDYTIIIHRAEMVEDTVNAPTPSEELKDNVIVVIPAENEIVNITSQVKNNDLSVALSGDLTGAVTQAEKAEGIWVWMKLNTMTAVEAIQSDVKRIEEELKGAMVGTYLDIKMYKQIPDGNKEIISETDPPITIQIVVPTDLRVAGRTFAIAYTHNGATAKVIEPASYDVTTGVLCFNASEFSTYALVYRDSVDNDGSSEDKTSDDKPSEDKPNNDNPSGDKSNDDIGNDNIQQDADKSIEQDMDVEAEQDTGESILRDTEIEAEKDTEESIKQTTCYNIVQGTVDNIKQETSEEGKAETVDSIKPEAGKEVKTETVDNVKTEVAENSKQETGNDVEQDSSYLGFGLIAFFVAVIALGGVFIIIKKKEKWRQK